MAESDEEQIETLKKWWEENGKSTIVGVVAALVIVFGYQGWQKHVREQGEAASALYEEMLSAVSLDSPFGTIDEEQLATGKFLAAQLKDEHPDSTYAQLASLFLAKLSVDQDDYAGAEHELNWALEHGLDDSLAVIAKIRLARVKLAQEDIDAALKLLEGVEPGEHRASYEELKGDIFLAQGNKDRARESYQVAINAVKEGDTRPMLQMKLDDLIAPVALAPADPEGEATEEGNK